jgi:choline dehydrogenase-like flavoprotein
VQKEVLLATGTLQTPALLERSGIGASAILSQFGINQLVNLPGVGLNLHDQPGTSLSALVNFANTTNTLLEDVRTFTSAYPPEPFIYSLNRVSISLRLLSHL